MSTDDDFETALRARLHDLADREDDWDDPAPTAREYAAAGIAPDDDPAIVSPAPPAAGRRLLPMLAVAAVLLAFVVGGGLGIRELARGGHGAAGSSSADDAAVGAAASSGAEQYSETLPAGPGPAQGGPVATGGSGPSGAGGAGGACADLGPAGSTGPLAGNGSIRPGGIVGPRVTSGGTVDVPYVLTFATAGPTAGAHSAQVSLVLDDRLVGPDGTVGSELFVPITVAPDAVTNGAATFHAVDCDGQPLAAGEYQVVVTVEYTVDGTAGAFSLVSAPLLAVVS